VSKSGEGSYGPAPLLKGDPFGEKARTYSMYRWDYAEHAIADILRISGVTGSSTVADIGSGTGILTKHFTLLAKKIYAVEPSVGMRREAERLLGREPTFVSVDGIAEKTTLPDSSVDLILMAQSIHWFRQKYAIPEFRRILRADGWIAVLWSPPIGETELNSAMKDLLQRHAQPVRAVPEQKEEELVELYLADEDRFYTSYENSRIEDREEFVGALCSISCAPNPGTPEQERFIAEADAIFDRFSKDGAVEVRFYTRLVMGRLRRP
jgi:ubiquinone/menaquinone biosynthesis C-methylase UbiE